MLWGPLQRTGWISSWSITFLPCIFLVYLFPACSIAPTKREYHWGAILDLFFFEIFDIFFEHIYSWFLSRNFAISFGVHESLLKLYGWYKLTWYELSTRPWQPADSQLCDEVRISPYEGCWKKQPDRACCTPFLDVSFFNMRKRKGKSECTETHGVQSEHVCFLQNEWECEDKPLHLSRMVGRWSYLIKSPYSSQIYSIAVNPLR